MPDSLTQRLMDEFDERAKGLVTKPTAAPTPVAGKSLWETIGTEEEPDWLQMKEGKSGALHFAGAALWHAFDVGLLGLPGITLGEEAPYQWDELGAGAKAGAVIGEAAGFLAPLGLIGKATSKAVAAASKYGTTAAIDRAVDAGRAVKGVSTLKDAGMVGPTISKAFKMKAAKDLKPAYELSTTTLESAQVTMGNLIRGSLKK